MLVNRTKAFDRTLDKATSKYKRSIESVEKHLDGVSATSGDEYPGFHPNHIRKTRIPLKEYGLHERKGLRFVFLVGEDLSITPVVAYKKGIPPQEHAVKALIKSTLKEILAELEAQDDPEKFPEGRPGPT